MRRRERGNTQLVSQSFGGGQGRSTEPRRDQLRDGQVDRAATAKQKQALRWECAGFDELSCGVIVAQKFWK